MLFYTQTTSIIINVVIGISAIVAIAVSLYFMSVRSGCSLGGVLVRFSVIFGIQLVSLALALGLALLVAVFMDGVNRSLSWFTQMWLIIGLYVLPVIFGMSFLPSLYMEKTKKDLLSLGFRVQLFMHSHCVCLVILLFVLTGLEIRSACFLMLCLFFDIIALIINLVTKWHRKGTTIFCSNRGFRYFSNIFFTAYMFAIAVSICQILPFTYFTYILTAFFMTLVPMQGRNGATFNPDLVAALATWLFTVLFAGFIVSTQNGFTS